MHDHPEPAVRADGAVSELSIRAAAAPDGPAVLALAERLAAFGPTTRAAAEIGRRERAALADALARPGDGSVLLVAERRGRGVAGVILLETRRDYFTGEAHGHVAILAVAHEEEGRGVGRALLEAAEGWGRGRGFRKLTLTVFSGNRRAKDVYERQAWRPELETWFKRLA
jgi:GNAT superfamily N-acetyltransferase